MRYKIYGAANYFYKNYRTFVDANDCIETLDDNYVALYPELYTKSSAELVIMLKCGTAFGSKCTNPVTSTVIVEASQYQVYYSFSVDI